MKRFFIIVTAALLILCVFAACNTKTVDLNAVMDDINGSYALGDLKVIEDTDGLHRYFQIDADSVKQFAAEISSSAKKYSEVILIEAVDQSAADTIKTQLETHLNAQLGNAKSYDAEQVAMLEACKVEENGNFVYLVIGDNHEGIEEVIKTSLN